MTAGGLIIAAPGSGSGKTTLTLGLLRAFRNAGVNVVSAKAGPDYIDPGFHAVASGRACINLDPWAMRPATIAAFVAQLGAAADLILCEGVMGLYDGTDASGEGSTAVLAAATGWPVVLVVDAHGLAASAAALVRGFVDPPASLARDIHVAGVLFNRVGGDGHVRLLRDTMKRALPDVPVLGAVPRAHGIALPERHLGLVPAHEQPGLAAVIDAAARLVETAVDLGAVRDCARPARLPAAPVGTATIPPLGQRVAVARDDAFAFAYPWVLDGWRAAGAEISVFAPLADEAAAADADAIYLPGGYPELHAGRLAGNRRFLGGLRDAAARGTVIYGECGGYMTLGQDLVDAAGHHHAMAGLLPLVTSFAERRLHLGYRKVTLRDDGPLGRTGTRYRGHEFHYATTVTEGPGQALFAAADIRDHQLATGGRRHGMVMGSFIHLIDHATV